MIYSGTLSAVVAVLAAECIDNTAKQAWQRLYSATDVVAKGSGITPHERMQADCWVHARLHSELKPRHWNVLMARYSTHGARKVAAISALAPLIASHAPALFVYKALTAWAIPQLKGKQVERKVHDSGVVSRSARADAERQALFAYAMSTKRGKEYVPPERDQFVVSAPAVVVLPADFYDMNTWDPTAATERTRRRWRKGVHDVLDGMVADALVAAEEILKREGVLLRAAA
ncbi:hypothetical protein [Pseudomonas sp. B1-22]|uniref:hypothetical protein n=1 Tax=Pseudomonas sp. B1-22 TaxID=3141456 RepID=UPI003D28F253